MKRVTALFLAAVLLLSLAACGGKDAWQEQYDLGMRYLNDGSYQEAVIAFEAAIEPWPGVVTCGLFARRRADLLIVASATGVAVEQAAGHPA